MGKVGECSCCWPRLQRGVFKRAVLLCTMEYGLSQKLSTGQASRQPQDGRGGGDWSRQGESWAGREGKREDERGGKEDSNGQDIREWDFRGVNWDGET
jgi:hypothetical protein